MAANGPPFQCRENKRKCGLAVICNSVSIASVFLCNDSYRMTSRYLSIDLGAESGRVILGTLQDGRIELEELSRFSNTPIRDGDRMYWNIPSLLDGIRAGLASAGALGQVITSVSADAWGVDYVLLDATGEIIEPVFHYRDPRTAEAEKTVLAKVDWPTLFEETGVQYMLSLIHI